MPRFFRKKPIPVEAVCWDGRNIGDFLELAQDALDLCREFDLFEDSDAVRIHTLEGLATVYPGDYIIKGVRKELYKCEGSIFLETYEEVVDAADAVWLGADDPQVLGYFTGQEEQDEDISGG